MTNIERNSEHNNKNSETDYPDEDETDHDNTNMTKKPKSQKIIDHDKNQKAENENWQIPKHRLGKKPVGLRVEVKLNDFKT